jgi:hypothetical protein
VAVTTHGGCGRDRQCGGLSQSRPATFCARELLVEALALAKLHGDRGKTLYSLG